jgi:hypothetical protein
MHSSFAILLSALAIATASPTLAPRACATSFPNSLYTLNSANPDESLYMPFSGPFELPQLSLSHQDDAASNAQDNLQYIDFTIPPGSYGCELKITDQANQLSFDYNGDTSASPPALNVQALFPNAMLGDATYNNIMNATPPVIAASQWGALTLARGAPPMAINSMPCPVAMADGEHGHAQFVLQFAQAGAGNSTWVLPQWTEDAAGVQTCNGIYMTYNC